MNKLLIGIDFGTSTNFVTKYDYKKMDAVEVSNMGGYGASNIIKNCIYIENENNVIIGKDDRALRDPQNYFENIKRYITVGKEFVVPNLGNKKLTAQELAQKIFEKIKEKVESNENRKIEGVVLTVPYEYGDLYNKKLKDAASAAGLNVIGILEEPVSAALAYGVLNTSIRKENILVFDLGGGTLDITIFNSKNENGKFILEVLNTGGVEKLGGRIIDEIIVEKLKSRLEIKDNELVPKEIKERDFILFKNAKKIKETLSEYDNEEIYTEIKSGKKTEFLEIEVTRDEFESWLEEEGIIEQIKKSLEKVMNEIKIKAINIDHVILSGGTSNIPLIKKILEERFEDKVVLDRNLGELVGKGASILAGMLEDSSFEYEIIRKTGTNIGINKNKYFLKLLDKNSKYENKTPKMTLKLPASSLLGRMLPAYLYEGVSDGDSIEKCKKIGKIMIEPGKYKNRIIKLSLEKTSDGMIKYYLWDINNNLIAEDLIKEI